MLAPLVVGALGVVIERTLLKHLYKIDPIYGLLLTFGLALIAEGVFRDQFGVSGQQYPVPELLQGATNLGFMVLPNYRAWVVLRVAGGLPRHLVHRSSARGSAPTCAPAPRTRRWCRPSASTCR